METSAIRQIDSMILRVLIFYRIRGDKEAKKKAKTPWEREREREREKPKVIRHFKGSWELKTEKSEYDTLLEVT